MSGSGRPHTPAQRGEYVNFAEGASVVRKINPWDVGGRSAKEKATMAIEMLREITRDIADVSSASATLLLKELARLYERGTPTTKDVMDRVEAFLKTAMSERRLAEANMAAALLRRLFWLQIDEERADVNVVGGAEVVIYDLSATGSNYLKTLYALTVLTKKYYEAYKRGPSNGLAEVIVAEECQNYVRGRRFDDPPSIGERTVNELRAYGVGVVLITPDPVQIPWHTARDVGAVIALGAQALPDFLEHMRHSYSRRGSTTIGKSDSTFVFHRSKLKTVRFKPRPHKPLRIPWKGAAGEASTGTWQPLGRYSRVFGRLRPVPGRPPPPPPTVDEARTVDRVEESLKLEDEDNDVSKPVEAAEAVAVEASPGEPMKLEDEEEPAEDMVKEEKESENQVPRGRASFHSYSSPATPSSNPARQTHGSGVPARRASGCRG